MFLSVAVATSAKFCCLHNFRYIYRVVFCIFYRAISLCGQTAIPCCAMLTFNAAKLSSLMACSSRQASASAVRSSTPADASIAQILHGAHKCARQAAVRAPSTPADGCSASNSHAPAACVPLWSRSLWNISVRLPHPSTTLDHCAFVKSKSFSGSSQKILSYCHSPLYSIISSLIVSNTFTL